MTADDPPPDSERSPHDDAYLRASSPDERIDALAAWVRAESRQGRLREQAIADTTTLALELAAERTHEHRARAQVIDRLDRLDTTLASVIDRLGSRGMWFALAAFVLHLLNNNLWRLQAQPSRTPAPREAPAR